MRLLSVSGQFGAAFFGDAALSVRAGMAVTMRAGFGSSAGGKQVFPDVLRISIAGWGRGSTEASALCVKTFRNSEKRVRDSRIAALSSTALGLLVDMLGVGMLAVSAARVDGVEAILPARYRCSGKLLRALFVFTDAWTRPLSRQTDRGR